MNPGQRLLLTWVNWTSTLASRTGGSLRFRYFRRQFGGLEVDGEPAICSPATPTSYDHYAPFQRYTHFGSYFTYPISTM